MHPLTTALFFFFVACVTLTLSALPTDLSLEEQDLSLMWFLTSVGYWLVALLVLGRWALHRK